MIYENVLSDCQIVEIGNVMKVARMDFERGYEDGCRVFNGKYGLFGGAVTLSVCLWDSCQDGVYSAYQAYWFDRWGDGVEVFDYDEDGVNRLWGDGADDAIEAIEKLVRCAHKK